ncbi:MAG: hypothetical protein ACT443_03405 [Gemmatimonadota bacterium]
MRRMTFALALVVGSATTALAQEKAAAAPTLPAGWQARFDRANADPAKVSFAAMGTGLHATSGPAAIYWMPEHNLSGQYRISATFTQMKAPTHPEAYGIFIGGKNLDTANQEYGYLIVRGDGKYAIKHRAGAEVHTITDWTELPALEKQDESGKATNTVTFEVAGGFVKALVNGAEVKRWEEAYWSGTGLAGLRVNHNLDVHISDFKVTPIK